MCIAEVFKEWGGHLFSILGIVGGLILYFRHDRKLKMQERLLNELQIKQYQKTEDEEKKARLECCVIKGDKGRRSIRFSNVGLADARNVRIEILNENDLKGVYIRGQLGPYDLITGKTGARGQRASVFPYLNNFLLYVGGEVLRHNNALPRAVVYTTQGRALPMMSCDADLPVILPHRP